MFSIKLFGENSVNRRVLATKLGMPTRIITLHPVLSSHGDGCQLNRSHDTSLQMEKKSYDCDLSWSISTCIRRHFDQNWYRNWTVQKNSSAISQTIDSPDDPQAKRTWTETIRAGSGGWYVFMCHLYHVLSSAIIYYNYNIYIYKLCTYSVYIYRYVFTYIYM